VGAEEVLVHVHAEAGAFEGEDHAVFVERV
jgi:hypothetical protein